METESAQLREEEHTQRPASPEGDVERLARRVEELERANRELERANADLARGRVGPRDSAANALLLRLHRAEMKANGMEHSVSWRITAPLRVLKPLLKPLRPWMRSFRERLRQRLSR